MRWFERLLMFILPYFDIVKTVDGERVVYLRRFFLWRNHKGRSVFLHHIFRSDDDPDPHDHPWKFTSFILSSGYVDQQWGRNRSGDRYFKRNTTVRPWTKISRPATHIHRVVLWRRKESFVVEQPAWTLVITGPHEREWGFVTNNGWVHYLKYLNLSSPDDYKVD